MRVPDKLKEGTRTVWKGLCFVLGGLLLLDFLVCLTAAVVSMDWLLNQVEIVAFTAAVLLLGILVYLPAKRMAVGKWPRRLLGFGLTGGGLVLVFFVVMYVAAVFYMLEFIKQVKQAD